VGLVSLNHARFADFRESFSDLAIGFTGLYLDNNFDQITLTLQQRMSAVTAGSYPCTGCMPLPSDVVMRMPS
jgi:hypothetical protein